MYSFLISLAALIAGYFIYGKFVEKVFKPNPALKTPAITRNDGVDFVPMPDWKVNIIQFLNIAGTGPIFGAIMGAKFGPSSYLWIVFGCIFAGAVHDYLFGMLSVRYDGDALPDLIGIHINGFFKKVMLIFSIILLLLVGVVFVYSPALILGKIAALADTEKISILIWVCLIFGYYIFATMVPVDKLIGRIYPLFAFALLFMAASLFVCLLIKWPSIPEFWQGLGNRSSEVGVQGQSIFPCLFITIACGAISGFHATQTPIMARCITNEKKGRQVFYGSMIIEGIVALIWAAVSSYFFFDGGMAEVGATSGQAPEVVTAVSKAWLGVLGGILAVIGVVAAPITSGDTAFRSARIIIADVFRINQKSKGKRLAISIPLFCAAAALLVYNIADEDGFNTVWRYFGLANQTLACFVLWMLNVYLVRHRKGCLYLVTLIPACFMSAVCITYICVDKVGFNLSNDLIPWIAVPSFFVTFILHFIWMRKQDRSRAE